VRGLSVDDMQAWSRAMVNAGTENRMLADQMEQVHGMLKKQEELLAGAGKVKPARGLAMLDKLRNLKDRVIVASSGKNMKKLCPNLHQRLSLGHNLAEWCQTKYMSDHFKRAMQEVGDNTVPGTSDMTGLLRRMELSQKMTATFDKEGEAEGMPLEQPESAQLSATMGAGGARPGTAPNVNFAATAGARMQGGRPGTALAATKGGEPYDAFDATAPGFGQTAGTSLGGGGGRSRRKKKSKSVTQPHFRKGMTREQKVNEWKRAKAERERRERERQKRKLHKWKSTGRQTPRKRFPITQQAFTHAIMHHQSLLSVGMDNLNAAECRKLWQKCKRDYHKFIKYLFSEEIDAVRAFAHSLRCACSASVSALCAHAPLSLPLRLPLHLPLHVLLSHSPPTGQTVLLLEVPIDLRGGPRREEELPPPGNGQGSIEDVLQEVQNGGLRCAEIPRALPVRIVR
jgi:hypothetical protein